VASCDQTGPHLYITEPSGNYFEYVAMAIGSRSQTSRTYLEKEYENFANCSVDDLIKHGLKSLASSLAGDTELDAKSASIAVVGINKPFEIIEGPSLQRYLDEIAVEQESGEEVEVAIQNPDF
jgi:20S proteasome subunit alpha 6